MRLEFHPSTVQDVNEATAYYEHRRAGLASEFRSELDAALARIAQSIVISHRRGSRPALPRPPFSVLHPVSRH